jgi:hypothetical protein
MLTLPQHTWPKDEGATVAARGGLGAIGGKLSSTWLLHRAWFSAAAPSACTDLRTTVVSCKGRCMR